MKAPELAHTMQQLSKEMLKVSVVIFVVLKHLQPILLFACLVQNP
jgi:hypothetical protein